MAQFKSPGLETRERFIGGSVRNRPSGRAGIVGSFEWGPVYSITTVTNTTELVELFGKPTNENYNDFYNAYNYLQYANDLRVVRVINEKSARNSTGLFDQVDFEIVSEGTGYQVGDKLTISYDDTVVEDQAEVTSIGSNGEIKTIFIPSRKIINHLKASNNYPTMTDGWSVTDGYGSLGVGSLIEAKGIIMDSAVTIVNSDFATQSLDDVDFGEKCVKYGLPRLSAIYAGTMGDDITLEIVSYERFNAQQRGELTIYPYGNTRPMYAKDYFRYGPQNENQYAIVVFVGGERRETHIVSTDPNDVDTLSGRSIYMDSYFDVGSSEYFTMISADFPKGFSGIIQLGGGRSSTGDITAGDYIIGLDLVRDEESIKISTLIGGGTSNKDPELATTVMKYASNVGESNQNMVVVLDPLAEDVVGKRARVAVANIVKRRGSNEESNMNVNSTYTVLTGNYALQYDTYNNVNRWVSLSGDMAGLMASVDARSTCAQSPAGTDFGVIKNKLRMAFNPNKPLRDQLTTVSVNPVMSFGEGSGFMFFADLTASYQQTHYDHINNRRVSNKIKELFIDLGMNAMFKNNTPYTRLQFKTTGDDLLKTLSGNTIEFGRVWCDERNNTKDVEFRKEFVANIYYKPYNSINYVLLSFVSVESDPQITEDIVRADDPRLGG